MPRPYHRKPKPGEIERDAKAVELVKAGMTYEQVGAELGCSASTAWRATQAAFARYAKDHGIEEAFQTDALRIDTAIRALWPRVLKGNDDGAMLSLERFMRRRAAMYGYDAPPKPINVNVSGEVTVTTHDVDSELLGFFAGVLAQQEATADRALDVHSPQP